MDKNGQKGFELTTKPGQIKKMVPEPVAFEAHKQQLHWCLLYAM